MSYIDKTKIKIEEDKLKTLIPVLRQKKRFIRFQIISEKKFTFEEFEKDYQKFLLEFMGIIEFGKAGVWILKDKFNPKENQFILRCNNKYEKTICALTCLIYQINNFKVNITPKKISGTLKGVQKEPKQNQ